MPDRTEPSSPGLRRSARRRRRRVARWVRTTPTGEVVATIAALLVVGVLVVGIALFLSR